MNEMKRGLFKDYYKNGEPKTHEAQDAEKFYRDIIGFILGILIFVGCLFYVIFCL